MVDEQLRGRFVWHELLTTDTDAAADFYKRVVGWTIQPWSSDASYTLFMAGDRPMAGLMILPEDAKNMGAPPHWLTYIGTANVDHTAQRAAELGGQVLRPAENIPSAGRFAIVRDPQGAVFGVYTPAQPQSVARTGQPGVGDFSWHELATDDWSAAWPFYQTLFGWEKTSAMDMGPEMGTYQMFGRDGQSVGGMFKRPPSVPAHWMPYVMLKDAKTAAHIVAGLGGRVVNGPMEVPGGDLIAQGIDPQGVAFAVHSKKPAATAAAEPAPARGTAKKTAARSTQPARKAKKTPAKKTAAKKPAVRKGRKAGTGRRATQKTKKTTRAAARTTQRRATTGKKRVIKRAKKAKKTVRRGGVKKQARKSARRASKKR